MLDHKKCILHFGRRFRMIPGYESLRQTTERIVGKEVEKPGSQPQRNGQLLPRRPS